VLSLSGSYIYQNLTVAEAGVVVQTADAAVPRLAKVHVAKIIAFNPSPPYDMYFNHTVSPFLLTSFSASVIKLQIHCTMSSKRVLSTSPRMRVTFIALD